MVSVHTASMETMTHGTIVRQEGQIICKSGPLRSSHVRSGEAAERPQTKGGFGNGWISRGYRLVTMKCRQSMQRYAAIRAGLRDRQKW